MVPPAGVEESVPEFAEAFPFESFNRMQRAAMPAVLDGDDNVVVSAPTASGKTALAELAICRTLRRGGTALFLAPLRALTNEKGKASANSGTNSSTPAEVATVEPAAPRNKNAPLSERHSGSVQLRGSSVLQR